MQVKIMSIVKEYFLPLRILLTPSCWLLNCPISKEWDKELNSMLDDPEFRLVRYDENIEYLVVLNGVELWVGNYPYSYGSRYGSGSYPTRLPNLSTVFRLHDALEKWKESL